MKRNITIGLIREEKTPPDTRVPMTPKQCRTLIDQYADHESVDLKLLVERSEKRSYKDAEYEAEGITLTDDLSSCDIIIGVKEVPISKLLNDKKYLFFSHTIKKQPYNRKLLKAIVEKGIQLIDHETLRWESGARIIGFGRFAGVVGAHNGFMAYGKRTGTFSLNFAHLSKDYAEIKAAYDKLELPAMKICLTGGGRVAKGAKEVLDYIGIKEVSPTAYLNETFEEAVYVQLDIEELYRHKDTHEFVRADFYQNPQNYYSVFAPYTKVTDYMINGIYWDNNAPIYFSKADMRAPDFKIKTIADVTCDIEGSIPATLRATVIGTEDWVMGYDPQTEKEIAPFQENGIDIMSIDNLPNELPRDASEMFGEMLVNHVIPALLEESNPIIERASVAKAGDLGKNYEYLRAYLEGRE